MEGSAMKFVLIFVAIFPPILCSDEQPLPLIGWSNTRSLDNTPRISAGKVVSREDLDGKYMASILQTQPQNILLFVFDELSIDDITRYSDAHNADGDGGAFSHLKTSMYESFSHLVLPMVEQGDLQHDMSSKVNGAVVDLKEADLSGLNLDLSKTNLIVKHFRVPSGDNDLKYEAFKEADKMIDSLVKSQTTHYTAILTAQHKSKLAAKAMDGERLTVGRHLLAVKEDAKPFIAHFKSNDSKCNVYMTASQLAIVKDGHTTIALPRNYTAWSLAGSSCDEFPAITLRLTLANGSQPQLEKFVLNLNFDATRFDFWNIQKSSFVEIGYKDEKASNHSLRVNTIETPRTFSYHCSDQVFDLLGQPVGSRAQLKFTEFQIQPYDVQTKKGSMDQYGPPNDCVGFFTEGIWMGLFMGLILLLILSFGLGMIANLKVMDKFDDPKGKTITINTAAE